MYAKDYNRITEHFEVPIIYLIHKNEDITEVARRFAQILNGQKEFEKVTFSFNKQDTIAYFECEIAIPIAKPNEYFHLTNPSPFVYLATTTSELTMIRLYKAIDDYILEKRKEKD